MPCTYILQAVIALMPVLGPALQSSQNFPLKRFEVIRVNPADVERLPASLRAILIDPIADGEPVDSLEKAAKRAGFAPRVPKAMPAMPQFGVTDPIREEATIRVADLTAALPRQESEM